MAVLLHIQKNKKRDSFMSKKDKNQENLPEEEVITQEETA